MLASDLVGPFAASIIGGPVVVLANHFMTKRREHEKRLVELPVEHLIEWWRKIEHAGLIADNSNPEVRRATYDGMDDAVARNTLLGTPREIEIADNAAFELSENNSAAVAELLNELRINSRRELNLEEVPKMKNVFFTMHRDKE